VCRLDHLLKSLIEENYFINEKKKSSAELEINNDYHGEKHHPLKNDILSFIEFLGLRLNCKYIVAFGCKHIDILEKLSLKFKIIVLDRKHNIENSINEKISDTWIDYNFEEVKILPISNQVLNESLILCLNQIEYLENPMNLLLNIQTAMKYSPMCLITTPERELQQTPDSSFILNSKRNWNISEFKKLLNHFKFNTEFLGLTKINKSTYKKDQILSIIGNENLSKKSFDDNFKVVALMAVYNEEDVIYYSINKLIEQKIYVYVLDNWSTDKTSDILKYFKNNPYFIGCERFPFTQPNENDNKFNFAQILERKEELSSSLDANWFIHCDADEIRESPWEELSLRDAIQYVDQMGYNAIDHTVINFHPIDNTFTSGDFEKHFKYFDFGIYHGGFIKTWKKTDQRINLLNSGGHDAQFNNRKVAPFKFLVKHYPLRSQMHAERKIFLERKPRFMEELKNKGWHIQYNGINNGDSFLRNPNELFLYSKNNFSSCFLVERLSNLYNWL
jgi:2-polyprenyl-3-methyl-5-hydroxy-6-metoxy-1,4-benzoquinol methylase